MRHLPEYLVEYPHGGQPPMCPQWSSDRKAPDPIDWQGLIAEVLQHGSEVPEIDWCKPGGGGGGGAGLAA